jgi:molybdopterin-binding protein
MPATPPRSGGKSPEFALLGFLYLGPCHGYELHQRLIRELGYIWSASQPETYNILRRLEAQGFIKSKLVTQEKLPPRRELSLTRSGRSRFQHWLEQPSGSGVRTIRLEFITRLYFARITGLLDLQEMIDTQVGQVRTGLRRLEGGLSDMPLAETYNRLGLEYQILQRKSMLDWLDSCRQTLNLHLYPEDPLETLFDTEAGMKLSARNILKGKVLKLTKGAVNTEVTLQLAGGDQVVSIITNTSAENLRLKEGIEAYAIIKASNVMIGIDEK